MITTSQHSTCPVVDLQEQVHSHLHSLPRPHPPRPFKPLHPSPQHQRHRPSSRIPPRPIHPLRSLLPLHFRSELPERIGSWRSSIRAQPQSRRELDGQIDSRRGDQKQHHPDFRLARCHLRTSTLLLLDHRDLLPGHLLRFRNRPL